MLIKPGDLVRNKGGYFTIYNVTGNGPMTTVDHNVLGFITCMVLADDASWSSPRYKHKIHVMWSNGSSGWCYPNESNLAVVQMEAGFNPTKIRCARAAVTTS